MGRRVTGADQDTRLAVLTRAGFRCELCYGDLGGGMSVHHRKPRRMGGTRDPEINSPANLLVLCGSGTTGCHGNMESKRVEAQSFGIILSSTQEPASEPFRDTRGKWWLLTTGGTKIELDTPTRL